MKKNIRQSDCPIHCSMEIFGDKWTLLILRDMILRGRRHFREFAIEEKISTNILSDRLNKLIDFNLIKKQVDQKNLSSYLYSLTDKALELIPIILEIGYWGAKNFENNNSDPEFIKRIETEREKVVNELTTMLRTNHNIEEK